jgi:acetylornithine/succinyldiaminopimelate/putrescine aminotransferase
MTGSYQEIGNGVPISAVITTLEIAKVLKYTYYFSTFGGNHACTVAGLAVLNVLRQINFSKMHKLCPVGSYLKKRLNSPMEKHESKLLILSIFYVVAYWIIYISNLPSQIAKQA